MSSLPPRPLDGLRILYAAATFPNRTQPWVLNWVVEALQNGADARICAFGKRGSTYQAIIDELRLLDRTTYLNLDPIKGPLHALATATIGDTGAEVRHGVHYWNMRGPRTTGRLAQIAKNLAFAPLLGLSPPNLIHSHALHVTYHLLAAAKAWRAPLVTTFHGLPPQGVSLMAARKLMEVFANGDLFLVNTNFARNQLTSLGCPGVKVEILPQGIVMEDFVFAPHPHPVRDPLRVLTVGRLHPDKGHRYMMEAMSNLIARGRNIEYHIIGIGPERHALEQLAIALGLSNRVHFHDELDDQGLREQYANAHVFVLPSVRSDDGFHEETQGVVIQEAQASGKLVIATRTGGIPECIDAGRSGILVRDRDPDALASAVEQLLDSPAIWDDWQKAGRKWVEERYSMPVLGRRLAQIYRRMAQTAM